MKKILIAEYQNYINKDKKPIGHACKAQRESGLLLKNHYDIDFAACTEYLNEIDEIKQNPLCIPGLDPENSSHLKLFMHSFKNIIKILKREADYIWFTNIDWILLGVLSIYKPRKSKIICTTFRNIIEDVTLPGTKLKYLKMRLVHRGLQKVDLLIVTNPSLTLSSKQIFVPDFYYSDFYKKYEVRNKKKRILVTGIMRSSKDILGLVRKYKKTDVEILIAGEFVDKKYLASCLKEKTNNITIVDDHIDNDKYYRLIAESEFVAMPYVSYDYKNATSGVLLETIFLKSVPIAPFFLLNHNRIQGIGYDKLNDLPNDYEHLHILGQQVKNDLNLYDKKTVAEKLSNAIQKM